MKRIMTLLAAVAIIAICGISASAKSPKATETAVFTVNPHMTCQNCENKIKSNLRFEKGVNSIAT
ncbi:MAG: heavy-metal-associated domain-containing protein, partial [Paramuribaculum sp.]|nr:heavy-metal-associated domain-containing protein [Paramuribaculum sp.]